MELLRALAAYCETPTAVLAEALGIPLPEPAEQTDLFIFQLYPYASVYLSAEGMLGGETGDRVAGFWRAVGLRPPAQPDHLAALLGLYALFAETGGDRARHARHALLWEHLLSWQPAWLGRVSEVGTSAYCAWAALLQDALVAEGEEMGGPVALPLHLRAVEPAEKVTDVLAAARSGVIVTRTDLGRAAGELDLGLRQGERRYALEALLAQDPPGVLGWLAEECRRQAQMHRSQPDAWRPVTEAWAVRAEATAQLLTRLTRAPAPEVARSW